MLYKSILAIAMGLLLVSLAGAQDYSKYVWEKLEVSGIAKDADPQKAELAGEVQKLMDAGIPMPTGFPIGILGRTFCFGNSGELIFALSEALPYLPEPMQPKVKAYMKQVVEKNAPWSGPLLDGEAWPMYSPKPQATPRPERMDVPVVNAYFMWKYADATGDWASIEQGYSAIAGRCAAVVKGAPQDYPQTLGMIGLARLARHFGKDAEAKAAEERAVKGLAAGVDYEAFFNGSYGRLVSKSHDWGYPPFVENRKGVVVTGFGPEIGRMLKEHAQQKVRDHADAVMNAWDRTWFMTRANMPTFFGQYYYKAGAEKAPEFMKRAWAGDQGDFGQENAYLTPDVGWGLFMIRAYVYGENGAELSRYLDVPWTRVGDVYQMQKLVATIRGYGQSKWVAVR